MTMTSELATVIYCVLSAAFGCLVTMVMGRRRSINPIVNATPVDDVTSDRNSALKERQLRLMVESLYNLTSQVDSQVGQHSVRVNQITHNLESPVDTDSSMVLTAGKLLITANQKLQADLEEAKSEIQRQREQTNACMLESRTDALTGLANRRAFDIEIARAFSQRRRDGKTFSLLIVDVDHFKRINDKYGHMVGDRLLKGFSRCLMNTFRDFDFVARYGGEEFVAIMPNTSLQEAIKAAERVRTAIADCRFRVGELEMQITASLGVKEVEERESEIELMEKADSAMYAAKRGGRNRCYYHDGTTCHLFVPPEQTETSDSELPTEPSTPTVIESDTVVPIAPAKIAVKNASPATVDKQVQL